MDPQWKKKQLLVMVRICCKGRRYWEEEKSLLYWHSCDVSAKRGSGLEGSTFSGEEEGK